MRALGFAWLCALSVLALPACARKKTAGGGNPTASPETVARAFVAAVNAGDEAALLALFPPEELIRRSITCEGGTNADAAQLADDKDSALAILRRGKGLTLIVRAVKPQGEQQVFKAGDVRGPCKANVNFTHQGWMLELSVDRDGKRVTDDERNLLSLIQIDGRWFLRRL